MCGAYSFVAYALLAFFDRGVLTHAIFAPEPYNLWNRDSGPAMNASGPQTPANSTSLYPDSYFNVSEECVLWDDTCHGDKQNAASIFFGKTLAALLENECFTVTDSARDLVVGLKNLVDEEPAPYDRAQCPGGISGIPPATSSLWSTLKSWMREPACASSSLEYSSAVRQPPAQDVMYGCCGPCAIDGPNVDVYYWPSPEANTSCLNIIGTSVNPPTEGATTRDGCQHRHANRYHYGVYFDQRHLIQNTNVESLGIKTRREHQYEPWNVGLAVNDTSSLEHADNPKTRRITGSIDPSSCKPHCHIKCDPRPDE